MIFHVTVPGLPPFFASAATWIDLRHFAVRLTGIEATVVLVETGEPTVELSWVGSDAGVRPDRRLQARWMGRGGWSQCGDAQGAIDWILRNSTYGRAKEKRRVGGKAKKS